MLAFFLKKVPPEIFEALKDLSLMNQKARALDPPVRRFHLSNSNRPKEFWHERDETSKKKHHLI